MFTAVTLPSLYRTFPDTDPKDGERTKFSALLNEPFSFQIAYKKESGRKVDSIYARITSSLPVSFYYAEPIPVMHYEHPANEENARPGLYPDVLIPKAVNPPRKEGGYPWASYKMEVGERRHLGVAHDCWQTLFFTVNEKGKRLTAGEYKLKVDFHDSSTEELIGSTEVEIELINALLPVQKLICTNWFHADCLCDSHGVEPMSDDFFAALYKYAEKATLNGQNMILTPCLTPPLDTTPGEYRRKIQLVGVKVTGRDEYEFDFSLLKRYIDTCKRAGIKYFEVNHLFTQWGAKAAPQIWAEVKGKEKRIFGWDTPATGKKYRAFLKAYLPALTAFFRAEGLSRRVLFHISDEPAAKMLPSYTAAVEGVGNMLDGFMVGDALSHFELYKAGVVKTPIVCTDHADEFRGKCDDFWCYYTGGQIAKGLSNRLPIISRQRNRMLGVQMYSAGVKGFLHWGYNYYYDRQSHGYSDPCLQPGNFLLSCGTSYLVYPARGLDCYQSVRQKIFGEAIIDHRALCALEGLTSRKRVEAIIEKHFGKVDFFTAPASVEQYLAFREEVNEAIRRALRE